MTGNCHVRFLEGRASAMRSGYSIIQAQADPVEKHFPDDSARDTDPD